MRPIDADALKEQFKDKEGDVFTAFHFYDAIDEMPAVNAVERKRGMWINDKGFYRCSACNELWCHWWASCVPIERMNKIMHFCPNCGADMRGEMNDSYKCDAIGNMCVVDMYINGLSKNCEGNREVE